MQSHATTVADYLAEQFPERRDALEVLLGLIRSNLPDGYVETMRWGMISFEVPLAVSGPTYNGEPISYVGLAAQARHFSVYLSGVYADDSAADEFRMRWASTGKKLDMGKSCVRFTSLDRADLDALGWAVSRFTPNEFLALPTVAARTGK